LNLPNLTSQINVSQLSAHLFWDIDQSKIDFDKNKKWLIRRVLEYGLLNDWLLIKNYYGLKEIGRVAIRLRDLDAKSISFISVLTKIPQKKFLCYTLKYSKPGYWDF
jgi:hypothetical protein